MDQTYSKLTQLGCHPATAGQAHHLHCQALHKPVEAVTVLMTSTKWLPQLLVMSYALTRHSPHRDRVLIVPQQYQDSGNFPAAGLDILQRRLGWKVRWVEHIPVPLSPEGEETFPIYRDVMNKIHIFNMTEYTAVAFFDLDGMILGSLDEAFAALYASGMKFASVGDEGGIDHVKLAPQAGCEFAKRACWTLLMMCLNVSSPLQQPCLSCQIANCFRRLWSSRKTRRSTTIGARS